MATIMIWGHADAPSLFAMWIPTTSLLRIFMDQNFAARRSQRCFVIIENYVKNLMSG